MLLAVLEACETAATDDKRGVTTVVERLRRDCEAAAIDTEDTVTQGAEALSLA